jgi:hypothetical protein
MSQTRGQNISVSTPPASHAGEKGSLKLQRKPPQSSGVVEPSAIIPEVEVSTESPLDADDQADEIPFRRRDCEFRFFLVDYPKQ